MYAWETQLRALVAIEMLKFKERQQNDADIDPVYFDEESIESMSEVMTCWADAIAASMELE